MALSRAEYEWALKACVNIAHQNVHIATALHDQNVAIQHLAKLLVKAQKVDVPAMPDFSIERQAQAAAESEELFRKLKDQK
jgi:hypothetical protein